MFVKGRKVLLLTQLLHPLAHFLLLALEPRRFLDVEARLRVVGVEDVDLAKVNSLAEQVHHRE